ncbi:MAG: hypothetical protein LWX56_14360 [Ignavibacteria bacterium]|nr:hypothetical protein [Ignavibacteria bacterium]
MKKITNIQIERTARLILLAYCLLLIANVLHYHAVDFNPRKVTEVDSRMQHRAGEAHMADQCPVAQAFSSVEGNFIELPGFAPALQLLSVGCSVQSNNSATSYLFYNNPFRAPPVC